MHSTRQTAPGVMLPHLRAWRRARGLTVSELARRAYCSRQHIYVLENGECGASRRFVPLLALALDVDSATLINRAPAAPQDTTAGTHPQPRSQPHPYAPRARTKAEAPVMAATP